MILAVMPHLFTIPSTLVFFPSFPISNLSTSPLSVVPETTLETLSFPLIYPDVPNDGPDLLDTQL